MSQLPVLTPNALPSSPLWTPFLETSVKMNHDFYDLPWVLVFHDRVTE